MLTKLLIINSILLFSTISYAFDFDIRSVRITLSKPDTSHSLIYFDPQQNNNKSVFNLTPINNERVGVFVDVNGIELGYAVDVFDNNIETKTQNFLVSYRKWEHSKITLNYQTLQGLQTSVDVSSDDADLTNIDSIFANKTKSTKLELFGLHNLYTFGDKQSLFQHFFLNEPRLNNSVDWSLSIVAGWSAKRLSLESSDSIIFQPATSDSAIPVVAKLKSNSFSINAGPFVSLSLGNNVHAFAEYKIGKGHLSNLSDINNLKESGDEKQSAVGAGLSWTSNDEKLLILMRAWEQKGKHIDTAFGDISAVWYF